VALDLRGDVAAGASTGGIAFMLPGRVGDTPLIGCGVYADSQAGAVSMTGIGESIIRLAMAKDIVDRLARGATPASAVRLALNRVFKRIATADEISVGALVLGREGRFAIRHTSPYMLAGHWAGHAQPVVADRFR
jgi:beta-aspartyl-peptidase (threonine type)